MNRWFILAYVSGVILLALLLVFGVKVGISAAREECGMCGAQVLEWWYVKNVHGDFITVCDNCYMLCMDDYDMQKLCIYISLLGKLTE